jgi:hypothetical protein
MNAAKHDTANFFVRKKIKRANMLAAEAGEVIWRPPLNEQYVLTHVITKAKQITGTVSDAPNVSLTNGTTAVVAAVDLTADETGEIQQLTVVGGIVIDNENPLTLVVGDAAGGATVFDVDIVLAAIKLNDLSIA